MQNIRTNQLEAGSGGTPQITVEDSILACASSMPKLYYAARLVILGDESDQTILNCEFYLYQELKRIALYQKWGLPKNSKCLKALADLSIAEHLRPEWFKNNNHRIMFYQEIEDMLKPENPVNMTIDKWKKKWGKMYKCSYDELTEMSNSALRQMKRKLG